VKGKGLIPLVIDFKGFVAHKNIKKEVQDV